MSSCIICASNSCAAFTNRGWGVFVLAVPAAIVDTVVIEFLREHPAASQHLQVGLQGAGLFHSLQNGDHIPCAPAPVRCNSLTRSSTVAPCFKSIWLTGLS
jgi:hypothetical protein